MIAAALVLALRLAADGDGGAESRPISDVAFEPRLGGFVPRELPFRDESGRDVRLGDALGARPVVLALVYFRCPMLCGLVTSGLVSSLRSVDLRPGRDFDVLVVSIDPSDAPETARARRDACVKAYGRGGAEGWRFWTGGEPAIRGLADAVGFRYVYDSASRQYAHASGVLVLTPDGRLARCLLGIEYAPVDLRLSLVEASAGRIGTFVDRVLLLCFRYDPSTGKYGAAVLGAVRAGGLVTVAIVAALVAAAMRRERAARAARVETRP